MKGQHYTTSAGMPNPMSQTQGLTLALRLLAKFPGGVPTVGQIQGEFGCSRATAYRWRAALRAAHPGALVTAVAIPPPPTAAPPPSTLDALRARMRAIESAPPASLAVVAANEAADDPDAGRIVEVETA